MNVLFVSFSRDESESLSSLELAVQRCPAARGLVGSIGRSAGVETLGMRLEVMSEVGASTELGFILLGSQAALLNEAISVIFTAAPKKDAEKVFVVDASGAAATALDPKFVQKIPVCQSICQVFDLLRGPKSGAGAAKASGSADPQATVDAPSAVGFGDIPRDYAAKMSAVYGNKATLEFDYVFSAKKRKDLEALKNACGCDSAFLKGGNVRIVYEEVDQEYVYVPAKMLPLDQSVLEAERHKYVALAHQHGAKLYGPFITSSP